MFTCNICLRKALVNLASENPSTPALVNLKSISRNPSTIHSGLNRRTPIYRRSHATLSSLTKGHHRRGVRATNSDDGHSTYLGKKRRTAPSALTKSEIRDSVARDKNKTWLARRTPIRDDEANDDEDEVDEHESKDDRDLVRPSEMKEMSRAELRAAKELQAKVQEEKNESKKLMRKDQRDVETYLTDPLQLADAVRTRLKAADIEAALRLVRASEGLDIKNIVSWNHCMDWHMAQGNIRGALLVYNELKKRGHKPDAHTYTIMLRGFSNQVHKPNAVKEAVKIYNSIFAPNSAVKPSTIHTNAIINVCARGGDMDALWAAAGRMPERGAGSPDRTTYTTILNAIRQNTIREAARLADKRTPGERYKTDHEARTALFEQAVADGRKLWEDVSHRWRRADLIIDEHLVCAMGRLIQGCGVGQDLEQVLDLLETTMNLRVRGRRSKNTMLPGPPPTAPPDSHSTDDSGNDGKNKSLLPLDSSNVYATPGPKTLSLILDAAVTYRPLLHLAPAYWSMLTDMDGRYRITPDAENITAYLRILRVNRASQKAYDLLAHQWPDDVAKLLYRRGSFVLAIRTCARDTNNPNVFNIAGKIVDLMAEKMEERAVGMFKTDMSLTEMHGGERKKALADQRQKHKKLSSEELAEMEKDKEGVESLPVDPKVLSSYLEIAVTTTVGWNEGLRGKDDGDVFERDPTKNHTMAALNKIEPLSENLKRLVVAKLNELQYQPPQMKVRGNRDPRFGSRVGDDVEDLIALMRAKISAYDKIVEIATRFKHAKKPEIDARMVEKYYTAKRAWTAYMARVDTVYRRHRATARTENDPDEEIASSADKEEDIVPAIERQIRAALGEVNTEVVEQRDERKGRSVRHVGPSVPQLKTHSRVLKSERDTKVKRAMDHRFPAAEYGILDENLNITSSKAEEEEIHLRQRQRNLGIESTSRKQKKQPMIGDELGLDDDDDESGPETVRHDFKRPQVRSREHVPFRQDGHQPRSQILNRPEIKRAWQRPAQQQHFEAASG